MTRQMHVVLQNSHHGVEYTYPNDTAICKCLGDHSESFLSHFKRLTKKISLIDSMLFDILSNILWDMSSQTKETKAKINKWDCIKLKSFYPSVEREVGGVIGMGNTCKPMAVSFQCMTKFTTNKKNKKIKKK